MIWKGKLKKKHAIFNELLTSNSHILKCQEVLEKELAELQKQLKEIIKTQVPDEIEPINEKIMDLHKKAEKIENDNKQ